MHQPQTNAQSAQEEDEKTRQKRKQIELYLRQSVKQPQAFIVFDDMAQQQLVKSKYLADGIKRCRHQKTCYVISSQYQYDIPPSIRSNIDYLYIFSGF